MTWLSVARTTHQRITPSQTQETVKRLRHETSVLLRRKRVETDRVLSQPRIFQHAIPHAPFSLTT